MESLYRGSGFIAAHRHSTTPRAAAALPDRVVLNILAELDQLLHVLMDEVARVDGHALRPGIRHSAVKLGLIAGDTSFMNADRRLRALMKTRLCLRDEGGVVRYPDIRGGTVMTLGWSSSTGKRHLLRKEAVGASARPIGDDLVDVARFYVETAQAILARAGHVARAAI